MIRFILSGEGKIFDELAHVQDARQRSHFEYMSTSILSIVCTIVCPQHKEEASAVIILDCKADTWGWQLVNSCCPEYGDALKLRIASIYPRRQA